MKFSLPSTLSPGHYLYINLSLFQGLQDHQACVIKTMQFLQPLAQPGIIQWLASLHTFEVTTEIMASAHPLICSSVKWRSFNRKFGTKQEFHLLHLLKDMLTLTALLPLLTSVTAFGSAPSTLFTDLRLSFHMIYLFYCTAWNTKFIISNTPALKWTLFKWTLFIKPWFRSFSLMPQKPFVFKRKYVLMTWVIAKPWWTARCSLPTNLLITSFSVIKLLDIVLILNDVHDSFIISFHQTFKLPQINPWTTRNQTEWFNKIKEQAVEVFIIALCVV